MDFEKCLRIETSAAKALAQWKALFADEVAAAAKILAAHDQTSQGVVTIAHYRQAAIAAVQVLADAVKGDNEKDGRQEAT